MTGHTERRVLVLRFSSVGDVVLTAPALAALKAAWPHCEIVYAVKEAFAPLVRHNPHVGRIVALAQGEGAWSFARRLRALGPFAAILDLHGKLRSRALRILIGGRSVAWKKRPWRDELPVRLMWRPYRAHATVAARYHTAVETLVGRALAPEPLTYWVGEGEQAEADAVLLTAGIRREQPILGLAPGANWATKRWPAERFAALARRARAEGMQVAVLGSNTEGRLANAITAAAPDTHDLTQDIPLAVLPGLIARCTAFVANDTGPLHLARALGVPTLALFGSTDPGQFDFAGHAVLVAGVPCAPCHFHGRTRCPKGHFRCMLDLDQERAWLALKPLLDGKRRAPVSG